VADVTSRSSRAVSALVALIVCVALPLSQLAIAGSITVTCCCGPHDVDDGCACPDCPGARDHDKADDEDDSGGGDLRINSCKFDIDQGVMPSSIAALVPTLVTVIVPRCSLWIPPEYVSCDVTRVIAPPTPDG
jgi:hypothetical protein